MVHLPVYTVHVPWTMKEMLDLQKKKKKKNKKNNNNNNVDVMNVNTNPNRAFTSKATFWRIFSKFYNKLKFLKYVESMKLNKVDKWL